MARTPAPGPGARAQAAKAARLARRAWPFVLAGYERWQALPEHKKQEYRARARETAARGRDAAKRLSSKRRGGR